MGGLVSLGGFISTSLLETKALEFGGNILFKIKLEEGLEKSATFAFLDEYTA